MAIIKAQSGRLRRRDRFATDRSSGGYESRTLQAFDTNNWGNIEFLKPARIATICEFRIRRHHALSTLRVAVFILRCFNAFITLQCRRDRLISSEISRSRLFIRVQRMPAVCTDLLARCYPGMIRGGPRCFHADAQTHRADRSRPEAARDARRLFRPDDTRLRPPYYVRRREDVVLHVPRERHTPRR